MLFKPMDFIDEVWLPITKDIVPGIIEGKYIASNYGYISDINYFSHHKVYSPKYCGQFHNRAYINLTAESGKHLICVISRIVAKLFCHGYAPGLEVNHLDGNPRNYYYKNLEWSTRSENIRHAYDNGLMTSLISEDMARLICMYLEADELSSREIAYVTGLDKISSNPTALISAIKKKKLWVHVSDEYNLPLGRHGRLFSDDQINYICELLEKNRNANAKFILDELGIIPEDITEYRKYNSTISAIRNRRKYIYISNNYSF